MKTKSYLMTVRLHIDLDLIEQPGCVFGKVCCVPDLMFTQPVALGAL